MFHTKKRGNLTFQIFFEMKHCFSHIFINVDSVSHSEHRSGNTKLLNTDPIKILIHDHNTGLI